MADITDYQNPYRFLELQEREDVVVGESTAAKDLAATTTASIVDYQNPYRFLEVEEREEEVVDHSQSQRELASDLSPSLEETLDEILRQYKPYVARHDWSQVTEFRREFLQQARVNPGAITTIIQRLNTYRFSLSRDEKVEFNRAPAARIISELTRLLR